MDFKSGQKVRVVNNDPLPGNEIAPPLTIGDELEIKQICLDKKGNQHLDVGIFSEVNFVRSFETKEELPGGDKYHWCHPSRFELVA
jgi:hypothetical protein